ncbi:MULTISPECIES: beta-glucosidase [unclassified Streptomyces]|uniref:beta-glucosidase n=1 Tax=unclassified Streptomyces TaxID=2593676 RepID=UPI00068F3796|nr:MULTISPECIES: glycoside hydrolase family 3 C-terminal domain-containing protein [unclassified Streptomyces]
MPGTRPRSPRCPTVRRAATGIATAVLFTLAPTTATARSADSECSTVPWMDTHKSADARAEALLAVSSPHQKYRWLVEQPANSPAQTTFGGVTYPAQLSCTPTVVYTDGPEGVRSVEGVTAFPAQIALAAGFDTDTAYDKGRAMGREAFDKGKNVILGPGVSGGRTPLAGRTPEYLGEDPVVNGVLAGAMARGVESSDDKPVLADLKHYVANEQETDRQTSSSNVDARTLKEIYELPYGIALKEGEPESVMCSYNQINGVYACENPLLKTSLKSDLGLDGYVMSDFGAVHSTAAALKAGLDQELNRPIHFTPEKLDAALAAGEISQSDIDGAAFRVVRSYIRGGLFDHPVPSTPVADASTAAHKRLARRIAEEGSVLLKNSGGTLPLSPRRGQRIAVIGASASSEATDGISATSLCSLPLNFGGTKGNTMACEDVVAPLDAIRERARKAGAEVVFDDGSDPARAAAVAAGADVALVFGYKQVGEFADPADLSLDGGGDALISAVAARNSSTVAVLETGTAVTMPWLKKVDSVLETWYPGEQQGPAIAALLFGDVNPSGKLPMTFPVSESQQPAATAEQYPGVLADGATIRQVDYSEGLQVGYRWYRAQGEKPLFEFGHGLSYTKFAYSTLDVTGTRGGGSGTTVRFRVTNTGKRTGTEVPQVYLRLPDAAGEPSPRLVSWDRVTLKPGESRTVTVRLTGRAVADRHLTQYWDTGRNAWRTPSGRFTALVGPSSDTVLQQSFTLGRR